MSNYFQMRGMKNQPASEECEAFEVAIWGTLAHLPLHHVAAVAHVDLSVLRHLVCIIISGIKDEELDSRRR